MNKLFLVFLLSLSIMGCSKPEDKAAALGFDSVEQMEEVKKLGFNSMNEYLSSLLPKSGCSNIEELKHAMQETGGDCNYLKKIRKEQDAEYAEQQRKEKIRKEQEQAPFPFRAEIKCVYPFGPNITFPLFTCFDGTELIIQNGEEYRKYTINDLASLNIQDMELKLRRNFTLTMQNGSTQKSILNLKIFNSVTNELVHDESAGKYEVIKVGN